MTRTFIVDGIEDMHRTERKAARPLRPPLTEVGVAVVWRTWRVAAEIIMVVECRVSLCGRALILDLAGCIIITTDAALTSLSVSEESLMLKPAGFATTTARRRRWRNAASCRVTERCRRRTRMPLEIWADDDGQVRSWVTQQHHHRPPMPPPPSNQLISLVNH